MPATDTPAIADMAVLQKIAEAAARHIRSFEPGSLDGSELALAHELASAGLVPYYFTTNARAQLIDAAKSLTSEILGAWEAFEHALRADMGNANYALILERAKHLRSLVGSDTQ